jgi:signal transduction histidine kinase
VHRFVDRVVLHRTDYRAARRMLVRTLSGAATPNDALDVTCAHLASALSAGVVSWSEREDASGELHAGALATTVNPASARVLVPTADSPWYTIELEALAAGRRLLSDDIALLETSAMLVARRIDELRVSEERFERDLRENDMRRLASEAELRALRAQLNPHFLFNALNTIGHLITSSPTRALETLYQLTSLLRAVLRRTGDFVTLDEELELVDAYLAIEQTRFEERLRIVREIPTVLGGLLVPPLILQPIVENAVRHGVSPVSRGGTITIEARLAPEDTTAEQRLCLSVHDDGRGATGAALAPDCRRGVGLTNVEGRLARYYGASGALRITSEPGRGTTVELYLAVKGSANAPDETMQATVHADRVAPVP